MTKTATLDTPTGNAQEQLRAILPEAAPDDTRRVTVCTPFACPSIPDEKIFNIEDGFDWDDALNLSIHYQVLAQGLLGIAGNGNRTDDAIVTNAAHTLLAFSVALSESISDY